ncbi:peptidase M3A and M3B thimet/oligopeptidase F [Halobiforma lacisalsi AJ5]|uniref:Peptidase M3A and M3B thimet/oligopeptidase F n=1 Tax=Natronobacterium lacisalsi AJ5 TaxID=358396 RepID=M0LT54_NATLA|nr:M3 family metallopeptidase [Halobiforma lacisalsi]APW99653.1 peptidase M3A and M3B thimet/oligopeptidase F [Halobiforma lacisalsi AJ5]EMA35559.1 peptidase M3A and M3B thimet/oligopeptidase F [Halobiforma lacisalsi AJ5]
MHLPPRTEIDPEYRFDLTAIFDAPADWSAARDDLRERLERLESLAADTPETAAELEELLAETEACYERRQRLELYAQLSKNVNTDSESAADRERALREATAAFEPVAAAVRRALGDLSEGTFDDLVEPLEEYRYYAANLRRQASHVRSPAVEDVIADHEEARSGSDRILREITTADFDPPTLERPDGETVQVRPGNYRTELSNPDRDYRRRVYEAYHAERNRFAATIVRASAEKLAAAATEADVRGYDSIRDRDLRGTYPESGLEPALPEPVHDTILEAVRANLEPYHRAQRVRREKLGLERLRPWDRRVSLADPPEPDLDYEESRELILESLAPLGEEYVARARAFLDDRRIDVYPTQDKRTDIPAYCPSSAADGAFVLANFRGDVRTTFYVAHELGHALAVAYNREGPTRYATCPTAVCEIPSILHELLLAEHCLERGGALAAHARNRLVECIAGNLYRNARTAAYNHALATTVESGEDLTVERARNAYADLLEEFDPVYDRDGVADRIEGIGLRIPYSSYQYVLGATGALAVRDRLRDGTLAADEYRGFLGRTGRRPPLESFAALDLDVRSHDPFERAAATFDGYLDGL